MSRIDPNELSILERAPDNTLRCGRCKAEFSGDAAQNSQPNLSSGKDKPAGSRLSAAVVKAAILDTLDEWESHGNHFGEDMWSGKEDWANSERLDFVSAAIVRAKQLSGRE